MRATPNRQHQLKIPGTKFYHFSTALIVALAIVSCHKQTDLQMSPNNPISLSPFSVNVSAVTSSTVTLSWQTSSNAKDYTLKYGTSPGVYTQVVSTNAQSPVTVGGLTPGTNYYFLVEAHGDNSLSASSNEVLGIPGSPPSFAPSANALAYSSQFTTGTWSSSDSVSLATQGGAGQITYSIVSGLGIINPTSGLFSPQFSNVKTQTVVQATDQMGQSTSFTLNQVPTWLWTNGTVKSAVINNNKLYIGGSFTQVGHVMPAPHYTALDLSTGAPQVSCNFIDGFDGPVMAIATSSDAIFVGGSFTHYQGTSVGFIAKLNLNCNLDSAFNQSNSGFNGAVHALAINAAANSLYVGGVFTGYRGVVNSAKYLAKLDLTSGNLDTTFTQNNSGLDSIVFTLAINAAANSLYVGGGFTGYRGIVNSAKYLAKLDLTSGNLDTTFTQNNSGFNASVVTLAINAAANSLYVGGGFTGYRGVVNSAKYLAKLDLTSGNLDTTFTQNNSGFDNSVAALAINLTTNSLYVGGLFGKYRGVVNSAKYLAKLDLTSGNLDTTFTQNNSGFDNKVNTLAINPSTNSLYVGGWFTQYRGVLGSAMYLAKLDLTSGNLDTTFTQNNSGFDSDVNTLAINPGNNSLYAGGSFTAYRGVVNSAQYLAKLDLTSGNLDTTFTQNNSGFDFDVYTLAINPGNNSLYVGGNFTTYRGVVNSAQNLAKLDLTSGNLDTTFTQYNSGFDSSVSTIAINLGNNSLYVGGTFATYRGVINSALSLAKLDLTSGNLDTTFTQNNSGLDNSVIALAINPANNSLYVGGAFTTYRGVVNSAQSLAKLDLTSGNLDTTFTQNNSGFNNYSVYALAINPSSNSLYVGGWFTQYRGVANSAQSLAKLDLTSGNLDTTFTQSTGIAGSVYALAINTASNSIYVGGSFDQYRQQINSSGIFLDLSSGAQSQSP